MSSGERNESPSVGSNNVYQGWINPANEFWRVAIPPKGDTKLQQYIGTIREKKELFSPQDVHCGTWNDSPNKEQHASFGDQGTTASANCYGDILQQNRNYDVRKRAEDLHEYCLDPEHGLSFGVRLSESLDAFKAKEVKCRWVNWRWPRFEFTSPESSKIKASFQYMVHGGVVLQQFVVDNTEGDDTFEFVGGFVSGHKIRHLDFVESPSTFNDSDKEYRRTSGPHGYGLISFSSMSETDENTENLNSKPRGVASVITVFIDGLAVETDSTKTGHCDEDRTLEAGETFEIIIAYKLVSISDTTTWEDFIISADAANINHLLREDTEKFNINRAICDLGVTLIDPEEIKELLAATQGTIATRAQGAQIEGEGILFRPQGALEEKAANPKAHLEYLAWRHLEYILSVCAMPFCVRKNERGSDDLIRFTGGWDGNLEDDQNMPFVALTCGDMSGHRIVTSTSYLAFIFLIRMARRLEVCQKQLEELKEDIPYLSGLQKRISAVCLGHARWLQRLRTSVQSVKGSNDIETVPNTGHKAEKRFPRLLDSGCFAANYWVTGEMIPRRGETWQPPNMITDTAFQTLKLTAMFQHLSEDNKTQGIDSKSREAETKRNGKDQRTAEDRNMVFKIIEDTYIPWLCFNKFRLDDHFWIWKALKSLDSALESSKVVGRHLQGSKSRLGKRGKDEPEWTEFESEWLSYLYKSEDEKKRFRSTLRRLEASNVQRRVLQRFTTENNVSKRRMLALTRSPRESRYMFHARDVALFYDQDCELFLSGSTNKQLWQRTIEAQPCHEGNQFTDWDNTLRYALAVAMGIDGQMMNDTSADDLVMKSTRVLLSCCGFNGFFPGLLDEGTKEPALFDKESDRDRYNHATFEINLLLLENARKINESFRRGNASQSSTDTTAASRSAPAGDKSPSAEETLLNILRRLEGITSRPESERKATMEKSIPSRNAVDSSKIVLIDEEWLYNYPEFLLGTGTSDDDVKDSRELHKNRGMDSRAAEVKSIWACVVDVPKQKRQGKRHKDQPINPKFVDNDKCLLRLLRPTRTSGEAKKRLIWLAHANKETEINCLAACPQTDRLALSDFFDRHNQYTKDIWDSANRVLNIWQTKLHLSFYVLTNQEGTPFVRPSHWNMEAMPRNAKMAIRRTPVSFHFSGDCFDRYWTCHVVDNINEDNTGIITLRPESRPGLPDLENKCSRQRKVLELQLVGWILDLVVIHANRILGEVQKELGIAQNKSLLSQLDRINDLRSTDDWHRFENILQMIEEDLQSNLEVLERWDNRVEARGQQQPRWTNNDETKYREALTDAQTANEKHNREIQSCRDQILKLKDDLSRSRQTRRDDLEFYGNQSIRYFTYVTIIFLPLGFATSFYSMSGPPDPNFLTSLVKFAVAAFAVTFVLLFIAAPVIKIINDLLRPVKNGLDITVRVLVFLLKKAMRPRTVVQVLVAFHGSKDRQISPQIFACAFLGVVYLPVLGVVWLFKLAYCNFSDLLQLEERFNQSHEIAKKPKSLRRCVTTGAITESGGQQEESMIERWYRRITDVPSSLRPWRIAKKHGGDEVYEVRESDH
ncbi:hypothetical protein diail_7684 [Diaporthe ilicicola]|nr:hypothetical protein diail_7684 [Diaporthe ilicicola]